MNKKGQKPVNLKEEAVELVTTAVLDKIPDYENVVGQDSLTRLDDKPRNKGNKNNRNNQNRNKNNAERNDKTARPDKQPKPAQQTKNRPEGNKKENVNAGQPGGNAGAQPGTGQANGGQPSGNRNNRNRNNRRKKPTDKPTK